MCSTLPSGQAQAKAVTLYRRNDLEGALAWSAAGNAAEPSDSVGMGTGLPPPTISPQTQLNLRLPTIRGGSLPGPSVVQVACLHAMGKTNELFALAQTAVRSRAPCDFPPGPSYSAAPETHSTETCIHVVHYCLLLQRLREARRGPAVL